MAAWVMAASVSGAGKPTCRRVWYLVGTRLMRRQLHTLQPAKRGVRKPRGGTRSLGFKRGTLVFHPGYGRCAIGGFDREKKTISLHAYRTNKRLTQSGKPGDCVVLMSVAFRSWLAREAEMQRKGEDHRTLRPE